MLSNLQGRSDPDKINAIKEMPEPSTPTEVRRFLGMVNQMGKFLSRLAEKTEPFIALITSKLEWMWGDSQQSALETIKEDLSEPPVLGFYILQPDQQLCHQMHQHMVWEPLFDRSKTMENGNQLHTHQGHLPVQKLGIRR